VYLPVCRPDRNSHYLPVVFIRQAADIPFEDFFFWFVHNSFAIMSTAQWLSKDHAHSFPTHGTSISNPSVLTAVPNLTGQHFCDGIMKNWFCHYESYLNENAISSHYPIRNGSV